MEYCGGGDLSTIIKQATTQDQLLPEDMVWRFFLQILQALHHCHNPNDQSRINDGPLCTEGGIRQIQILHRDLKPANGLASTETQTIDL
jgi:NIMA (never in mitosis gene a)-related kinase 2